MRFVFGSMRKVKCRARFYLPGILQNRKIGIQTNSTQRYDDFDVPEQCQLTNQEGPARQDLLPERLVIRGNTAYRSRDIGVPQP